MASVNRSLHQLLSLSFLTFILVAVESFIVTGCFFAFLFSFSDLIMLLYFIHPFQCWSMLTYLAMENRRVVRHFECICRRLADKHHHQVTLNDSSHHQQQLMQSTENSVLLWSDRRFIGQTKGDNNSINKSDHLRLHELLMFKPYFEMRLFDMATVNLSFTLAAALFALQNVIFFVQTN